MRYNTYDNGGAVEGIVTVGSMNLTGYLVLKGDPIGPLEAASRQYVLLKASSIKASSVVSGVFNRGRMPALSGAIATVEGNAVTSLAESGVLAGTYTKVTVNSGGLVTSGSNIVSSDVPSFNWNKIVTGKPTSLLGYGILNGVERNGGDIVGNLTLFTEPVDDDDVATKNYTDVKAAGGSAYAVGDIVKGQFVVTPNGLLRCNGGEILKDSYPALYSVVGDRFSNIQTPGAGRPWEQQYAFNDTQNGAISNWTTGTSLPYSVMYHRCVVTKNRIYMLGGFIGSTVSSIVYSAPINADGTLGTWVAGTNLPGPLAYFATVVIKNKLYLIGGGNASGPVATVYVANINADGTLGAWSLSTPLPGVRSYPAAFVTKNKLFVIGGNDNGSNNSTVFVANINADGTLGAWVTSTPTPVTLTDPCVAVVKNKVYLISGVGGVDYSPTIYSATINADGSLDTWVNTGSPVPVGLAYGSIFVTKTAIYLLGGAYGSNLYTRNIYRTTINADGSLGAWVNLEQIPYIVGYNAFVVVKNKVHILGGYANNAITATVSTGTIVGGSNDYSPYYDGSYLLTADDKFRLPDYTTKEDTTGSLFVRY